VNERLVHTTKGLLKMKQLDVQFESDGGVKKMKPVHQEGRIGLAGGSPRVSQSHHFTFSMSPGFQLLSMAGSFGP